MRGANIFAGIVVVLWLILALIGSTLIQGLVSQQIAGYPNGTQVRFFIIYPIGVAVTLVGCALVCNRRSGCPAVLGCLSATALLALPVYFIGFGGGV